MKQQIVVIHGGETFDTYEEYLTFLRGMELDFARSQQKFWKESLAEDLGDAYELIFPRMPNALNAKYAEWKIYFDKYIPYVRDGVILIGHSLGGIFLAKYLSEQTLPLRVAGTLLLAAPHDAHGSPYSLSDFALPESLELFAQQGGSIYLFHSTDDPVVKYADVESFARRLPHAQKVLFTDRGHFVTEKFPELIDTIKELAK